MSDPVELLLLTKPGCHLCDDARIVVERVCEAQRGRGIPVACEERNILDDVALTRLHAEDIPVVFVNGRRHSIWHVDEARLTAAIARAASPLTFDPDYQ